MQLQLGQLDCGVDKSYIVKIPVSNDNVGSNPTAPIEHDGCVAERFRQGSMLSYRLFSQSYLPSSSNWEDFSSPGKNAGSTPEGGSSSGAV